MILQLRTREFKDTYPIIQIEPDGICCLNRIILLLFSIVGEDPESQSNYNRRLGMYDWQEHEDRMKRKYGDIVTTHIPFFRNREP